jgi:hypothetical protein
MTWLKFLFQAPYTRAFESETSIGEIKMNFPSWMGHLPRQSAPWSPEEKRELISGYKDGLSVHALAAKHGRAMGGIESRLAKELGPEYTSTHRPYKNVIWYRATFDRHHGLRFTAASFEDAALYVARRYGRFECTGITLEITQPAPPGWDKVETSTDVGATAGIQAGECCGEHAQTNTQQLEQFGQAVDRMTRAHSGLNAGYGQGGEADTHGKATGPAQDAPKPDPIIYGLAVKTILGLQLIGPFYDPNIAHNYVKTGEEVQVFVMKKPS